MADFNNKLETALTNPSDTVTTHLRTIVCGDPDVTKASLRNMIKFLKDNPDADLTKEFKTTLAGIRPRGEDGALPEGSAVSVAGGGGTQQVTAEVQRKKDLRNRLMSITIICIQAKSEITFHPTIVVFKIHDKLTVNVGAVIHRVMENSIMSDGYVANSNLVRFVKEKVTTNTTSHFHTAYAQDIKDLLRDLVACGNDVAKAKTYLSENLEKSPYRLFFSKDILCPVIAALGALHEIYLINPQQSDKVDRVHYAAFCEIADIHLNAMFQWTTGETYWHNTNVASEEQLHKVTQAKYLMSPEDRADKAASLRLETPRREDIQAPPSHGATGSQLSPSQRFERCKRCEQHGWTDHFLYNHDPNGCTRPPRKNFGSQGIERASSADKPSSDKSGGKQGGGKKQYGPKKQQGSKRFHKK